MKKMNFTSITLRFAFLALGLFSMVANANAQRRSWWSRPEACFSEKIDLNLGDPNTCETILTTADLDGEHFIVTNFTVRKPGINEPISGPTPVTTYTFKKADVGQEFEVMFMSTPRRGGSATMCFVNVRVYDNTAPAVTPKDITIRCTDLVFGKAPAPGVEVNGVATPNTKQRMPQPTLPTDNPTKVTLTAMGYVPASSGANTFVVVDCHNFSASYEDLPLYVIDECPSTSESCVYGTIYRIWTFKDKFGNIEKYKQVITVVKPRILFEDIEHPSYAKIVVDPAVDQDIVTNVDKCDADVTTAGFPFIDWNCNGTKDEGETVESGKDYCGRTITLGDVTRMNTCPGSYMLTRTWKYLSCQLDYHGNPKFYTVKQVVNVKDKQAPTLSLYFQDYLRVPKEQQVKMGGMCITQYVYETVVDSREDSGYKGHTALNGDGTEAPATIKITPLMDLGTCDEATFKIKFQIKDPKCSNGPNTIGFDGIDRDRIRNLKVNGMLVGEHSTMKVDDGVNYTLTGTVDAREMSSIDPFFYIKAYDPCGNVTVIKLVVNVIDNLAPTTYCEDKEVTLNNAGEGILTGKIVSGGTNDNCTEYFEAATMLEEGSRKGRILIRRTGTDCWDSKLILTCADLGELKVDVRAIDMMGNYTDCCVTVIVKDKAGPTCPMSPTVTTVCTDARLANPEAFFTQPVSYDNCETPQVISNPVVLNLTCGAGDVTKSWTFRDRAGNSTTCTQKLVVTSITGFRVKPLASEIKTCSYTFDKETERKNALAAVRLLKGAKTSNGKGDVVEATCSGPVVEVESWEYSSSEFCKIYRIRYTLQDICQKYEINSTLFPTDPCFVRLELKDGSTVLVDKKDNCGIDGTTDIEYTKFTDGTYKDFYQANKKGYFSFERFVYVRDKKAPVSTVPAYQEICIVDNSCKWDFPIITLTGKDLCDDGSFTNSNLYFAWTVNVIKADGTKKTVSGNTAEIKSDDLKGLKFGEDTVRYSIQDGCGNINWYDFRIKGKDCKSPYINTHDKNTVLAYTNTTGQGMSILHVSAIVNSLADNCTGESYLRSKLRFVRAESNPSNTYPANAGTEIMFTCNDLNGTNPVPVQIWTVDEAGNEVFNVAYVTVEDNHNACGGYVPQTIIAGGLKTEGNQAAKNVTVSALANGTIANTIATDNTGDFTFNVAQGNNYVVKAAKATTEDKYAGVTTFDIARISKHLLDIEKFNSAYQVIASDVDKSGDVDGADMLHIRNFILRKSTALPGGVWRFVDKTYNFKNPANPFGEDFPEVISLNSAKANEAANFVAVKLGDVNATYSANLVSTVVRNSNALTLNVEDRDLVAGNEYSVNVTAENFNAAAFQGTFNIANASIKSVKAGDLANYNDGNFGIFGNAITTSWNGTAAKAANVFTVTFTANKAGKLSEVLTVGSSLTPAVANDANGTEMNINLKFSTGKVAGAEFALYQNTPNPVATETSIGFNMPKDGAAKLTIYNVEGKVVLNRNIDAKAGLNNVTINKSDLSVSGVLYYRLETSEFSATKKMIIIE